MLGVEQVPLLAGVSESTLEWLRQVVGTRCFEPGDTLVRAGDAGECVHFIVEGAVKVDLAGPDRVRQRAPVLGPGQSIGEISMLTGLPISATIVAVRRSVTLTLSARHFVELIEREPRLGHALSKVLAERLRARTEPRQPSAQPIVVAWVDGLGTNASRTLGDAVTRRIQEIAPASTAHELPQADPAAVISEVRSLRAREAAAWEERFVVLRTGIAGVRPVFAGMEAEDLALIVTDPAVALEVHRTLPESQGDHQLVLIGERRATPAQLPHWPFVASEVVASGKSGGLEHTADAIARYVTRRTVGIAMSVGAAAGLAHFGALEVIEGAGIPVDYLCGSSMGGIAALAAAALGAHLACEEARARLGSNAAIRDAAWFPRSSLYAGERIRHIREEIFGDLAFTQLARPAAVVAADVIASRRVVIDSGSVAQAAHATGAIPGLFPPLRLGKRVMVDGAVVSRIPVDLLSSRRCGYRIAITVEPESGFPPGEEGAAAMRLESEMSRVLGLRAVVAASWRLLGWWDAEQQARGADAIIKIKTPREGAFNFDAAERLIEQGRRAASAHLEMLKSDWSRVLRGA